MEMLFTAKKKMCDHTQNTRIEKYFLSDGTPMINKECSCGYKDNGHVYGDNENWEHSITLKENGVVVFKQIIT